jgi:hypothetical protein
MIRLKRCRCISLVRNAVEFDTFNSVTGHGAIVLQGVGQSSCLGDAFKFLSNIDGARAGGVLLVT